MIKGTGQRLIPRKLLEWIKGLNKGEGASLNITTLTDSKGNPRFIEGDGTPRTQTGLTSDYCKWSLSGTHLMVVFAANVANATSLTGGSVVTFTLPDFIKNKIVGLVDTAIEVKKIVMYAYDLGNQQTFDCILRKTNDGLSVNIISTVTLTADRAFRLQFDLLIDSE